MGSVSEKLKACGVKVNTMVKGVPGFGSGILYLTPNFVEYNYVLTARHVFQETAESVFAYSHVGDIEICYSEKGKLTRLELIKKIAVKDKLIVFDEDFAILIVKKIDTIAFRQILVSDELQEEEQDFFSWATFSANKDELHRFDLQRNDPERKRLKLVGHVDPKYLPGMSGAGVFHAEKSVLYGIITSYPNEELQNDTVDCASISFVEINAKLKSSKLVELDIKSSGHKREVGTEVVDIHQAFINSVCLDLEMARKRLKTDISDDWYYDPLKYIDLLNQSYLFEQLEPYFGKNGYTAKEAERFYVPKKKFTLRLALVSPFIDRILYMAAVGTLADKLDRAMIPNVYSARYNRFSDRQLILNGVEQWKKMQYRLAELAVLKNGTGNFKYGCLIEIDLLNFYDNISKSLLHEKILRVCENDNEHNAAKLLNDILHKFSTKELGLPQNSDASSLLASFYLNQVDIFMSHHAPAYFRFMDDIRIFCKDKYEARKVLQTFEFELRRCYLSVNSQKTEIYTLVDNETQGLGPNEKRRSQLQHKFDIELNKIARLRHSQNHQYLNEAFHGCITLLKENLTPADDVTPEEAARKLNYAFNTISSLAVQGINLEAGATAFRELILQAAASLTDKPWLTPEVCRVLSLLSTAEIKTYFLNTLKKIVLKDKYNTYSFQTYQIWLLLAKHKCDMSALKKFAIKQIEKNDDTNKAVIAAMVIYMCSVDNGYRRVVLRKFAEGFTHGYFENRVALIALRAFKTEIIDAGKIDPTLTKAHAFTHKFKTKDLVFVQGFEENEEDEIDPLEQLYSI